MKVDFIELTNFRGIQKQRIRFKNKNFVALIGDNARVCLKNKNCTKRMFYFPFS